VVKGVRRLNDSERELVAYLRTYFAFRGAAAFVRKFGPEVVSRAVSDYEAAPDLGEVESPAAFLVWLVRDLCDG
jgi:hypothetical protein